MSGRFTQVALESKAQKHDHIDIVFEDSILRYTDARRFGCFIWSSNPFKHPLLAALGPEPFSNEFSSEYVYRFISHRKVSIKVLLMNAAFVVGVGNIYASESLFRAKIDPRRSANSLSKAECEKLVNAVQVVLLEAIEKGGSTLRDYALPDGDSGYFQHSFSVYARAGKPCCQCGTTITKITQGQRSTFMCANCQR